MASKALHHRDRSAQPPARLECMTSQHMSLCVLPLDPGSSMCKNHNSVFGMYECVCGILTGIIQRKMRRGGDRPLCHPPTRPAKAHPCLSMSCWTCSSDGAMIAPFYGTKSIFRPNWSSEPVSMSKCGAAVLSEVAVRRDARRGNGTKSREF